MEILKGSQGTVNPRTPSQVAHFYQNVNFENLASDPTNHLNAAFRKGSSEGDRTPHSAARHGEQTIVTSNTSIGGRK